MLRPSSLFLLVLVYLPGTGAYADCTPARQNCHVYFEHDSHILTPEAIQVLNDIAQDIRTNATGLICVEGHTDRTGPARYNMQLSKKRALEVATFLQEQQGVQKGQLRLSWHGESNPPFPTDDGVPEPLNRCVKVSEGS